MSVKRKNKNYKGFDRLVNELSDDLREKTKAHLLVVVAVKNKHQVVVHGSGDGSPEDLDALKAGLRGALKRFDDLDDEDEEITRLKRKLMRAAEKHDIIDEDGHPTKKALAHLLAAVLTDKSQNPVEALNEMSGSPLTDKEVEQLKDVWEDEDDDED